MREELIKKYQDTLLNIYTKQQLHECPYDFVLVFKDQEEYDDRNILYTNYHAFFKHQYLNLPIAPIRKLAKLLTYYDGIDILKRIHYGSLAITNDIPYCIGLTHFIVDGHIYFHTGYKGYKLNGMDKIACYHVIEDLGIHEEVATQNYQSVLVYGTLKEVKDNKEALINALLNDLTPHHNKKLTKQSIENTLILELTIDHMDVKRHFH